MGQPVGYKDEDGDNPLVSQEINKDLHVFISGAKQNPELYVDMEQRVQEDEEIYIVRETQDTIRGEGTETEDDNK